MKRNIKICCEAMLKAIGHRDVVVTAGSATGPVYHSQPRTLPTAFSVTIRERSGNRINNCPWCGKELPFAYEEEP